MSVYIKGMEMPTSCWLCHFQDCGNCRLNYHKVVDKCIIEDRRDEDCPLVPVPEHGRLCNKDDVLKIIDNLIWRTANREAHEVLKWAKECLSVLPTIIPADQAKEVEG